MAWSKIVGLEVNPVTDRSPMYRLSVPLSSRSRVMLSSQMLCPRSWSDCVAFMVQPPGRCVHSYFGLRDVLRPDATSPNGAGLRVPDLFRIFPNGAVAREFSGAGDIQNGFARPFL